MKKLFTLIAALVCAVCINAQTTTTLWEGNTTFDESWSGSIVVGTVSNVKAGDKLILTAKSIPAVSWQWGSQLFVKTARGGWDAISSTINVNSETENQYEVLVNDDEITITEKDASGNIIDDAVKTSILKEIIEKGISDSDKSYALIGGKEIRFDNSPIKLSIDIRPRSSVWKTGMVLSNSAGTVN